MKKTIGATLALLALLLLGSAVPALAVTEHCPAGGVKDESGADDNRLVPAAGTLICVKASTEATGIIEADGTTTLREYLFNAGIVDGSGEQGRDVSYWVTYEAEPTPTPTPTATATATPTLPPPPPPPPTPTPTVAPTPTPTPTPTPVEPTPTPVPPTATPVPPPPAQPTLPPTDTAGTTSEGSIPLPTVLVLLAIGCGIALALSRRFPAKR